MKNIIFRIIAGFYLFILTSCGSSSSRTIEPNNEYFNIVGTPIKVGNLEISQHNFPKAMNWVDATKACSSLGKGWRLPTKDEILFLQKNIFDSNYSYLPQYSQYNFDGLSKGLDDLNFFWSSTEKGDSAWGIHFIAVEEDFFIKSDTNNVRPVRSLIN